MRRRIVICALLGLAVLTPAALSLFARSDRDRGEYFTVVVGGVVTHSVKKAGIGNYYRDARGVNNALQQLDEEGYEPVQITGVGDNSVVILARRK